MTGRRRRKRRGCASLIGVLSQQETSHGRGQSSSLCQVGREDSWLFCESVNQAQGSHSCLAFALLSGLDPGGLAFPASSCLLATEDHFGGARSPRPQAVGQDPCCGMGEPPAPCSPRAALCLSKAVPLRWGGKGTCSLFRPRLGVPQGWPQRAISGSMVVLGLLEL